jgi:hypothetical protein
MGQTDMFIENASEKPPRAQKSFDARIILRQAIKLNGTHILSRRRGIIYAR